MLKLPRVWIVLGFPLNDSTPLWKQVVSCQGLFCWSLSSVGDDEGMKDLLDRLPFLAKVWCFSCSFVCYFHCFYRRISFCPRFNLVAVFLQSFLDNSCSVGLCHLQTVDELETRPTSSSGAKTQAKCSRNNTGWSQRKEGNKFHGNAELLDVEQLFSK